MTVLTRDFGLGLAIGVGLLLLMPGGWDAKLFAFVVTLALAGIATLVELRKRPATRRPSLDETLRRGLAAFPTKSRLGRSGVVLGAFASGDHAGQHFVLGLSGDGLTWWGAKAAPRSETIVWQEGIPHQDLRELFGSWDARFLDDGTYAADVLGTYFPELLEVDRGN
ncbi:hypothetical protein [Agromyces sp. SYSU T00266]|uniref:hypothetical protein n=1 Tax=Agromyces zhanjiangensis TaxID=3158562 RepID=UPI0033930C98